MKPLPPPGAMRTLLRFSVNVVIVLVWGFAVVGLHYTAGIPPWIVLLAFVAVPLVYLRRRRSTGMMALITLLALGLFAAFFFSLKPTNNRIWSFDQARLPRIVFNDNLVTINDFRDFTWYSATEADKVWTNRTYNLDTLERIDVVVVPLGGALIAHTMLSFGFANGDYLCVSVEARREAGENYGLIPGLFRQFELMYVLGSERDLFGVRAVHRDSELYVYPTRFTPEFARALLTGLLHDADSLREHPAFYLTIQDNCTTRLARHISRIAGQPFALHYEIIFSGLVGRRLYTLGQMDTDLTYEEAERRFNLTQQVRWCIDKPHFSQCIRSEQAFLDTHSGDQPAGGRKPGVGSQETGEVE